MCQKLSLIVLRDRIIHIPGVDSHSDILTLSNIPDNKRTPDFVKIETFPGNAGLMSLDFNTWVVNFDQDNFPEWFDEVSCRERIIHWLQSQPVLTGSHDIVQGHHLFAYKADIYKTAEGAIIDFALETKIYSLEDFSHVYMATDCEISYVRAHASISDAVNCRIGLVTGRIFYCKSCAIETLLEDAAISLCQDTCVNLVTGYSVIHRKTSSVAVQDDHRVFCPSCKQL